MQAPAPSPRPRERAGIAAPAWWVGIALFCAALSLRPVNDTDVWFQLLAGRYALGHGSVPHHEFFLYTAGAGAAQLFGGWGFGLLGELAVRLAGFAGLGAYNALLWATALLLGLLAAQRASDDGEQVRGRVDGALAAGLSIALLVAYQGFLHRSDLRAEVTLYLAWMAATLLFEAARHDAGLKRALAAFPLLCLGLAWLHTTVLLMLPLLASYALRRWLRRQQEPLQARELAWWAASALASVTLPLLNPNGAPQVFAQLGSWTGMGAGGNAGSETLVNLEYLPLLDPSSAFMWPALAVLAIGSGVWLVLAGPARWPGLVAIAPMVVMAFQHRRGVGLWAMALLVPLACALVKAFRQRPAGKRLPTTAIAAACLALLGLSVFPTSRWGIGLAGDNLRDSKTLAALKQNLPEGGNIWAFDGIAPQIPYFLGESYKIAYAGHMVIRHPDAVRHYTAVMDTAPGWEKELGAHGVSMVVATDMVLPDNRLVPIAWRLGWHPQWRLVAIDRQLLVFQRRPDGLPPSSAERRQQASAIVGHALQMAQASQLYAPNAETLRLIRDLRQQHAALEAAKERPDTIDWAALDRAAATPTP
jgi:hypothetical protein